ncbi:MAG: AraC family transcriptional regulator [Pseudomonadota bacterium]
MSLIHQYVERVAAWVSAVLRHERSDSFSPLEGIVVLRRTCDSPIEVALYKPAFCLVLQGRKEVMVGDRVTSFGPGESLIVSHELPVTSRIIDASPTSPYLALVLSLDIAMLRGMSQALPVSGVASKVDPRALAVHSVDQDLMDAVERYLLLSKKPQDRDVLAPLVSKEIHYRLLTAPHGAMLRQLMRQDSRARHIAQAISNIRRDFKATLIVSDLAKGVGMSTSAFHTHFKDVTETTPLQYQKELRLLEAKRLIYEERLSVSAAAFEVGYGSATQFSREYSRKFGVPPSEDRINTPT